MQLMAILIMITLCW